MAITDELRKTLSDPTPLYFAAGTADLAFQQAKKVPGLVEQLRAEAPGRIEAVRNADPKAVQDKAAARAREVQETVQVKMNEFLTALDGDFKKLGDSAQDLALRGVGVAAEYAVKARETYEKVAEHGERTVRTWRGEPVDEDLAPVRAVAPAPEPTPARPDVTDEAPVTDEVSGTEGADGVAPKARRARPASTTAASTARTVPAQESPLGEAPAAAPKKPAARKAPARKPAAKKDTPPAAE
ncbi:hypothetical protein ACSMX9_16155 [Streptomyces sp. LE64]|uniref:hypothetical protein n=1 Tax=Streptomyces sp. LE64 TaxID=3448653 RepID=UPI0040415CE0